MAAGVLVALLYRERRARRHAAVLVRQIETLPLEVVAFQDADVRRTEEATRRKRCFQENDVSDVANQIKFVSRTELRAVRPVNREAAKVLCALDEWIAANRPGWRMSFEVSMGAFIRTPFDTQRSGQDPAFSAYNGKRVDFLVIDRFGYPKLAIEYHGTGHDISGDAEDRMEVKRLALRRAGIPLTESLRMHPNRRSPE